MLVKSYDWSDDKTFLALSNLLTGESLRVLQTLSLEQQNYDCLKQALLKKFFALHLTTMLNSRMLHLNHMKTPMHLFHV